MCPRKKARSDLKRPGRSPAIQLQMSCSGHKQRNHSKLKVNTPGPGYSIPDRLSTGVLQPTHERGVRTRFVRGHPVRYWFKPSGKRNEALDHRVYALAALHSRPVPWEVLFRAAPTEPPPRPLSPAEVGGPPARGHPHRRCPCRRAVSCAAACGFECADRRSLANLIAHRLWR
jgi:phage terminase large subunit GpA-like protein